MDNRYYDNVIAEMKPFLDENGFKAVDGGFENDTKKISIIYDEEKQCYSLLTATKDESGNFGEMTSINTWLFDDTQNAKDAGSVGIDFTVSLRKELGIKLSRPNADVALPTAEKSGNMTVNGFTKKMLDVFPNIKDNYKDYVATYGNFLYINFFGEYLIPQIKGLFNDGNKKQIKKFFDVLNDVYIKGDTETVNIMLAVLAAVAYGDEKYNSVIIDSLSEDSHFTQSFKSISVYLPKSKNLFKALVK